MRYIFAVIFVVLSTSTFALSQTPEKSESLGTRSFVAENCIIAMEMVAEATNDAHAKEMAEIWRHFSVLLEPVSNGNNIQTRVIMPSLTRPIFGVLPVLKEDTMLKGPWKDIFRNVHGVKMLPYPEREESFIAIVFTPMSKVWRGLDGLHETIHLIEFLEGIDPTEPGSKENTLRKISEREASAYEFLADIVAIIGQKNAGANYQQLLLREAQRFRTEHASTKSFPFPPRDLYRVELEKIFGPSASCFEDREREAVLWVGGLIQSLDNLSEEEARQKKEAFFTWAVEKKLLK